jgi:hypothetical protein
MKAIILALLVAVALAGLSDIAITPIPAIVRGTASKFYLGGSASSDYLFKVVNAPNFVTIGTDGLISCEAK